MSFGFMNQNQVQQVQQVQQVNEWIHPLHPIHLQRSQSDPTSIPDFSQPSQLHSKQNKVDEIYTFLAMKEKTRINSMINEIKEHTKLFTEEEMKVIEKLNSILSDSIKTKFSNL